MFKTGTHISLHINLNMCLILSKQLGIHHIYKGLFDKLTIEFTSSYQKPSPFGKNIILSYSIKMFDEMINKRVVKNNGINTVNISSTTNNHGRTGGVSVSVSKREKLVNVIDYKGYTIWEDDNEIKIVIDKREELISYINSVFMKSFFEKLSQIERREDFIFPMLSKELFDNTEILVNKNLSLEQYKNLKHSTIVYNRKLKKLQQLCKIETNLTSHVPRHSFTNILLKMKGVNLYDISQSLGHTSLKTTENYIRNGFNVEKIDYLSKEISLKFNLT